MSNIQKEKIVELPVTVEGVDFPAITKGKIKDVQDSCPCIGCEHDSDTEWCTAWKPYWKCSGYTKWLDGIIAAFPESRVVLRNSMIRYLQDIKITEFMITCDLCIDAEKCEWSYDPYNTDGDCLGVK